MDEKKSIKERVACFCNKHEAAILMVGGAAVTSLLGLYSIKQYKKGFIDGGTTGFHCTMKWFDEEFGTNLAQLYGDYAKANPDKIIYMKR